MAGHFPEEWLDELRARTDIVQVVSQYVPLKKNGSRYWGLCPFHGEKTASFSVEPNKQMYYCFGCKAGGNVIHFVMEMERLSFPEAVEQLAEKAGIPLPQTGSTEDYERRKTQRERLFAANREAAMYYHRKLFTPEGKAALDYLKKRGVDDNIIRRFGLGAAGDGWDECTKFLKGKGYSEEELALCGICVIKPEEKATENSPGKPRRVFDMFRSRAMFPIIDKNGNVIAFGGRTLGDGVPKYLNTSDTPVFNKRKGVYAANLLQKERHLDRVVLVEGYMDVVSLSQFGVKGVVATLGTALTNEQARFLSKYASTVCLAYDGDSAGQHAILRGLDILQQENVTARVIDFPDGLDPDEFIRRDGIEGFEHLKLLTPEQYRLRRLKDSVDMTTQEGKTAFAKGAAKIISGLEPVEMENEIREIVIQTGFSREVLMSQVRMEQKTLPAQENQYSEKPVRTAKTEENVSEEIRSQEVLVSVMATGRIPGDIVADDDFTDDFLLELSRKLHAGISPAAILDSYTDENDRARAVRLLFSPPEEERDQLIQMARDCLKKIRRKKIECRMKEIVGKVNSLEGEEKRAAISEYSMLQKKYIQLK